MTKHEAITIINENVKKRVETASVNDYILYHSTYPDRALTILEQGEFKFRPIVGTRSDQNVPNSYFLSLTRSKLNSFAVANSAHYYVMFNLNRRTIAKRFKIYPVSYWQDRGNVGKTQFNDEAEERITSNTPEGLKIPANAKELIDGVHILAEQKSIDKKTYPKATERLLKLVRLCKAKRIPVFIYADKKSFLVQNKLRTKPLSYLLDAYQALRPEIRDAYVYRGSDRRKSYDGVRIHGLIQLFKVDKYAQLDKHAKKVWYDWVRRANPAYGHLTADVVTSLEAAIHNANSQPNSQIRKTIDALVAEMKKHGFKTLKEMLQGLNVKWSKILDAKDKAERESWEASKKLFDLDGYYGAWITDSGDYIGIVSKKGYINTVAQQFPNDAQIQKFADAKDYDGLSAFLMRKRGWIRLTLPRGHDEASGNEDVDTHSPDYHRRATIDMANNRASHKALETLERLFRSGGGGLTEINVDDKHFEFTWRNSDERKKLMRAQYNRKGIPEFKKNEETAQAEGQMPYGYWISPNGKIENVDFEKHWYLASAVIRSRLNAPSLYKEYPTEALQTAYGYARTINRYFATDRNSLSISIPKGGLTSTQASALASIFKDNGFDKAVVEIISEQPDAKGFEHDYARANSLYELNVVLRKNVAKKQITANVSHSWIDDDDGRFWLLHGGAVVWVGHPAQYDHEHRARELILRDHKKEFAAWRKSDKGREYYPYTAFAMRELGWIRMAADNAYDVAQKEIAKPAAMKLIRALSQRRDDPENPITYYVAVVDKNHPWGADTAVPTKKFTRREAMQQIAHNIKGAVAHASLDEITLRYIEGFHDFENEQIVRPLYFEKHKALFNTWDGFYRDKLEPFAKKYKLNKANRFKVLKRVRLAFMLGHREGEIPGALKAAGNVFEEILARYRGRKATPKGQLELFASDASIWDTNNNCFIDAEGKIHWIDEDHMDFAADWIAKHPADKKEFEDQQYSSTVDYLLHRGWVRVRNTHRNAIEISKDRLSLKAYRTLVRQLRDSQEDTYLDVTYHEKNILRNIGGKFEPHERSRLFSVLQDNVAKHEAKAANARKIEAKASVVVAGVQPAFWIGEKIRSPYMVVLTVRTRGKLFRTPIGWNKRTFISGAFRRFLIYKYVGVITPRQLDLEIQNVMALIARQNGTRVDIRKARRAIQRTSLGFMGMGASIKVTAGAVNWDTGKPILRKFYDTRTLGNFPLTKKQCQSWGIIQGTPISTAPIQLKNITTFDAAIAPRDFSVMYRKFSNAFAQKIAQRYNSIVSRYESEALAKADMSRAIDMIVSKGGEAMCLDYLRDRFEEDLTFKRKLHKKEWRVIYRAMISYTRDRLSQLTPIKGVL